MAYKICDSINNEIESAFDRDLETPDVGNEPIKKLLKNHKKLTIKILNRKWDIASLQSHVTQRVIPRGLRERVVPAQHLHTPRFLEAWKKICIDRGIELMKLIIQEEQSQLGEIQLELDKSTSLLEPFGEDPELIRFNENLKKEVEKLQRTLKFTKQKKFKQNIQDSEQDNFFDPTKIRSRSRSRGPNRRNRSNNYRGGHSSGSESDSLDKTVTFLGETTSPEPVPDSRIKQLTRKGSLKETSQDLKINLKEREETNKTRPTRSRSTKQSNK